MQYQFTATGRTGVPFSPEAAANLRVGDYVKRDHFGQVGLPVSAIEGDIIRCSDLWTFLASTGEEVTINQGVRKIVPNSRIIEVFYKPMFIC